MWIKAILQENHNRKQDKKQPLEQVLQIHHQEGNGNRTFSGWSQLRHDPTEAKAALAHPKLALNLIAQRRIGEDLLAI